MEKFELCELIPAKFERGHNFKGMKFLYSDLRIKRSSLPKGLYAYGIRECDSGGGSASLSNAVIVNHYGDVMSKTDFKLNGYDSIELERYGVKLLGKYLTIEEFMKQ